MKKLSKYEIKAVAEKIIDDVNAINEKYNEGVLKSKAYLDKIDDIKSKCPNYIAKKEIEKSLKLLYGTDYEKSMKFSLSAQGKNSEKVTEVSKELADYKKSVLKPILSKTEYSWNNDPSEKLIEIQNQIIVAQIDATDLQTVCNLIKASLI